MSNVTYYSLKIVICIMRRDSSREAELSSHQRDNTNGISQSMGRWPFSLMYYKNNDLVPSKDISNFNALLLLRHLIIVEKKDFSKKKKSSLLHLVDYNRELAFTLHEITPD